MKPGGASKGMPSIGEIATDASPSLLSKLVIYPSYPK